MKENTWRVLQDVREACGCDEHYFVFEDILLQVRGNPSLTWGIGDCGLSSPRPYCFREPHSFAPRVAGAC